MLRPKICISSKNLCCDLKFSHHNFIHSYSGCNLDSLLRPRKFPGLLEQFNFQQVNSPNPIKTSTIQFLFIIQIFNKSIQLCTRFKIEEKKKIFKIFPKLSIMLYRRKNSINQRRVYCPFLSLVQIGILNAEIRLCTLIVLQETSVI